MKYRIMVASANGSSGNALYKYLTVIVEGEEVIYEASSLAEVDAKVEEMINGEYKRKDIIVISPIDYEVLADIVENQTEPTEPTP